MCAHYGSSIYVCVCVCVWKRPPRTACAALQLKKMERNREKSNQLMFEAVMNDDALAFRQSIQDGAEVRVRGLPV
eukprot:COSAG05_NODE_2475_length_3014_cov_3.392453_4_plen_74_part_01